MIHNICLFIYKSVFYSNINVENLTGILQGGEGSVLLRMEVDEDSFDDDDEAEVNTEKVMIHVEASTCNPDKPDVLQVSRTSNTPDTPHTPETPDTPETPETPEKEGGAWGGRRYDLRDKGKGKKGKKNKRKEKGLKKD